MTLGSLFDGIAGFPLAACRAGIVTLWASEIEPFPIQVSTVHFPEVQQVGDITKLDGAALPPGGINCRGRPSQALNVAGARAGLAGERSGLFLHQIRVIKEMRNADIRCGRTAEFVRPRWMLWENVPGAFSSGQPRGEDFRAVLEETAKVVDPACHVPRPAKGQWLGAGCILADGFSIAWRTVDAQFFGVPQRRKRIALVADFAGLCAPEVLFIDDGLPGYYPEGQSPGEAFARSLAAGA